MDGQIIELRSVRESTQGIDVADRDRESQPITCVFRQGLHLESF
jgi:hypothetical protein